MQIFERNFPDMVASRYEQNEDFFVRMGNDPEMMKKIMKTVGSVLYKRLKETSIVQ